MIVETYFKFRPTGYDSHITIKEREDWLVLSCSRNRDSDCLEESNFAVALERLGGESETVEVHRFGHWANGWFELILVAPNSDALKEAEAIEAVLEDYPILDEGELSQREYDEADRVWRMCYTNAKRLEYIRDNRDQFEFSSFADLLGCVRGNYFSGYASELLY